MLHCFFSQQKRTRSNKERRNRLDRSGLSKDIRTNGLKVMLDRSQASKKKLQSKYLTGEAMQKVERTNKQAALFQFWNGLFLFSN